MKGGKGNSEKWEVATENLGSDCCSTSDFHMFEDV
jgi:hypothetical protein